MPPVNKQDSSDIVKCHSNVKNKYIRSEARVDVLVEDIGGGRTFLHSYVPSCVFTFLCVT